MTEYVNAYGQSIDPFHTPSALAPKMPARRSDGLKAVDSRQDAKESNGLRVVGHPPGALEAAHIAADKAVAEWAEAGPEIVAARLREGRREPKPWDEAEWRTKTKPKAVRSKPYEIEDAAIVCANLARKAGWLEVRIVEMLRG